MVKTAAGIEGVFERCNLPTARISAPPSINQSDGASGRLDRYAFFFATVSGWRSFWGLAARRDTFATRPRLQEPSHAATWPPFLDTRQEIDFSRRFFDPKPAEPAERGMPGAARPPGSGVLTGVAYEIDAVTGTDYDGLPYITSVESTGNLTTASGSLPIQYNEQFPPGYATMNGTVNFTFPQTVTPGQTASISASAQATWNNSGLGFGRPTSIDIGDGIGPDGLDDKGSFANGSTSAQVNWSDSVAVSTGPGSVTLPPVTVTVDGKEDKIITLTASYSIVADTPSVTTDPADQTVCDGMDATFTVVGDGDPTPDVQWEESDNGGSFYPIPGATDYTLVVTAHAPMNSANCAVERRFAIPGRPQQFLRDGHLGRGDTARGHHAGDHAQPRQPGG